MVERKAQRPRLSLRAYIVGQAREVNKMEDKFRMMENKVIKWFIKNYDVNFGLSGFKYITYILTKRLLKEWENEKITAQYLATAIHFNIKSSQVERDIRHFISHCEKGTINSKFLAKIYYLIKIYLDERQGDIVSVENN